MNHRTRLSFENLKRNWILPVSAAAFFCLNTIVMLKVGYMIAMVIAFAAWIIIASYIPSVFEIGKKGSPAVKIVAVLSAIGICWSCRCLFILNWSNSSKVQALENVLPFAVDLPKVVSICLAVAAFAFVYLYVLLFLLEMIKIAADVQIFDGLGLNEIIIYLLLLTGTLVLMTGAFSSSLAFYGSDYTDTIYTSDSGSLVIKNAYMSLIHPENDLRQPLFALFAAPFMGIPYLLGRLFPSSASVQAILLNAVQILMLFAANFMLAKLMELTRVKRICFMVLSCMTYMYLLFSLMMEQYIVAYFWLILCIYLICEKKLRNRFVLWGAGGTLLTSLILLPLMSDKSPFKNFKVWIGEMARYVFEFILAMLVFCRFDVIFSLTEKISSLRRFTGASIALREKMFQYTRFVHDCFMAPDAGENYIATNHISWHLNQATGISLTGMLILLFCLLSAWLNRNRKSSLIAAGWIGFSLFILIVLGWGTSENGLILYTLYFGWAFLILLFQLVEWISEKMKLQVLVPIAALSCVIVLAAANIPAIMKLIQFAAEYYPV